MSRPVKLWKTIELRLRLEIIISRKSIWIYDSLLTEYNKGGRGKGEEKKDLHKVL